MKLVDTIVPEMPTDRKVVATVDWNLFFKVDYAKRILYIPTEKAMRMNHLLIDQFIDAVKAFANSNLVPPSWDAISYQTDEGNEERALELLRALPLSGVIACDIETRNLSWQDNGLLSIGFGADSSTAMLITTFTPKVLAALREVFSRSTTTWLWHNGKFDTGKLKTLIGVDARVDEDTMLMHYVGVNERRGTHGLKELGAIFLQAPDWDATLNQIKKERCKVLGIKLADFDYGDFPRATLYKYAAYDVVATYRLYYVLKDMMRPESERIYRKLIEASNAYRKVELNGAYIDIEYLEDLEFTLDAKLQEAHKQFDEAVEQYWDPVRYRLESGAKSTPGFFNLKSPLQLKWLLTKVLGRPITSTNKEELEPLLEEVGDQYPLLQALKEMRRYDKYMDTYIMGLREVVDSNGRIHSSYNLHGTETGRLSSSEPNVQNIPRDAMIKNLFIAPKGKCLMQFDYSQAELRVLAWLSQDKFLKGIYQDGKDLHDSVATKMFGPDFTKEQRVQAKTINFGIAYGRGASNIAQVFKIPQYEAQKLIDNWFKQMPQVEQWIRKTRSEAVKAIAPSTIMGRERHFVITFENYSHVQNEGVNFPIQSIASDMTLCSLIELQKWIEDEGLTKQVSITITVHDSIVVEVDDNASLRERVAEAGIRIMSSVPAQYLPGLDFPFKADVEFGYKWGELHAYTAGT